MPSPGRPQQHFSFTERILGMKSFVYGDIAHVLVLTADNPIPESVFE